MSAEMKWGVGVAVVAGIIGLWSQWRKADNRPIGRLTHTAQVQEFQGQPQGYGQPQAPARRDPQREAEIADLLCQRDYHRKCVVEEEGHVSYWRLQIGSDPGRDLVARGALATHESCLETHRSKLAEIQSRLAALGCW